MSGMWGAYSSLLEFARDFSHASDGVFDRQAAEQELGRVLSDDEWHRIIRSIGGRECREEQDWYDLIDQATD